MTLDETIKYLKEDCKVKYEKHFLCHTNPENCELEDCTNCFVEQLQLAKWLEELKYLREEMKEHERTFEHCTECKEYNYEKCCCHRWNKVIKTTVQNWQTETKVDAINVFTDRLLEEIEKLKKDSDITNPYLTEDDIIELAVDMKSSLYDEVKNENISNT